MVEINDRLLAQHVITQAREYGEWGDVYDTVAEGEYGQHEHDVEWSLADMNPDDCDVDMDDNTVVVTGTVEGEWSVKVSSARRYPTHKAHPAEWEHRSVTLLVQIEMELGELPIPVIHVEPE